MSTTHRSARTKKILIASLAAVLIAIGMTALILGLVPVRYDMGLSADAVRAEVKDIGVYRGPGALTILRCDDYQRGLITNANTKEEIFRLLHRGGRTNQLSQLFRRAAPRNHVTPARNTSFHNIRSQAQDQLLQITFRTPQFAVIGDRTDGFELVPAQGQPSATHVRQIIIPLYDIGSGWTDHTWYLSLQHEEQNFVQFQMSTRGNFRPLYNLLFGPDAVRLI